MKRTIILGWREYLKRIGNSSSFSCPRVCRVPNLFWSTNALDHSVEDLIRVSWAQTVNLLTNDSWENDIGSKFHYLYVFGHHLLLSLLYLFSRTYYYFFLFTFIDILSYRHNGCLFQQPQVSSASVELTTETATVCPVSEAKVTANWQQQLGEALAKHLTTCGFASSVQGQYCFVFVNNCNMLIVWLVDDHYPWSNSLMEIHYWGSCLYLPP